MDRTSGQPQVKLSLLRSISLKISSLYTPAPWAHMYSTENCTFVPSAHSCFFSIAHFVDAAHELLRLIVLCTLVSCRIAPCAFFHAEFFPHNLLCAWSDLHFFLDISMLCPLVPSTLVSCTLVPCSLVHYPCTLVPCPLVSYTLVPCRIDHKNLFPQYWCQRTWHKFSLSTCSLRTFSLHTCFLYACSLHTCSLSLHTFSLHSFSLQDWSQELFPRSIGANALTLGLNLSLLFNRHKSSLSTCSLHTSSLRTLFPSHLFLAGLLTELVFLAWLVPTLLLPSWIYLSFPCPPFLCSTLVPC